MDKTHLFSKSIQSWENEKLALPESIRKALIDDLGYDQPSKIQAITIPIVTSEPYPNFIAQSINGSGKTLAFVLSSLLRVDPKNPDIQVVVLIPNRELAKQTYTTYTEVAKYAPEIKICLVLQDSIIGTTGHIIIGTPGALIGFVSKSKPKFQKIKMLIIDEADMAFDPKNEMGKIVIQLYKFTNPKKQTLLFSATFEKDVLQSAKELVKEASIIKLTPAQLTLKGVTQLFIRCEPKKKFDMLYEIYSNIVSVQTIVFANTKKFAESFSSYMTRKKVSVGLVMGGMQTIERDAAIASFKDRKFTLLVTTNLLARGFDNRSVTLVINLDIPRHTGDASKPDTETYLHRIGRTGRFGDIGVALNIVENEEDLKLLDLIKAHYGSELKEISIEKLSKTIKEIKHLRDKCAAEEEGGPTEEIKPAEGGKA